MNDCVRAVVFLDRTKSTNIILVIFGINQVETIMETSQARFSDLQLGEQQVFGISFGTRLEHEKHGDIFMSLLEPPDGELLRVDVHVFLIRYCAWAYHF